MTQTRSRRRAWPALLLAATLLAGAGITAFGADAEPTPGDAATEAPEATPEPTPFPAFDPSTVRLRTDLFVDGLDAPVYLTDDGTRAKCLYVVERGGTVRIVESDGFVRRSPFLDISKLVSRSGRSRACTASPSIPTSRRTVASSCTTTPALNGASVIAEFRGKPCGLARKKPVKPFRLTVEQPFPNNNGGWIGFGPDGYLYVALGDGGGVSPGDPNGIGQTKSSPLAKMLRLDVDSGRGTRIAQDQPLRQEEDRASTRSTWAWGLRDPRRASFDRKTGDLWIGDVGQDRFEEVDRIPAGVTKKGGPALNFGWSHVEGESTCHPNVPDCDPSLYEPPVHSYDKVPPHRGITGGYVYRGEAIPELDGVYLFSDFASGYIWGLDAEAVAAGWPCPLTCCSTAPPGPRLLR